MLYEQHFSTLVHTLVATPQPDTLFWLRAIASSSNVMSLMLCSHPGTATISMQDRSGRVVEHAKPAWRSSIAFCIMELSRLTNVHLNLAQVIVRAGRCRTLVLVCLDAVAIARLAMGERCLVGQFPAVWRIACAVAAPAARKRMGACMQKTRSKLDVFRRFSFHMAALALPPA